METSNKPLLGDIAAVIDNDGVAWRKTHSPPGTTAIALVGEFHLWTFNVVNYRRGEKGEALPGYSGTATRATTPPEVVHLPAHLAQRAFQNAAKKLGLGA